MDELTKLLTKIELKADDIIDTKQQIVNLDAKRHKIREALSSLKDQHTKNSNSTKRNYVCVGDMFIRLNHNSTRNLLVDDQYHIDQGIEKLRNELGDKVNELRELEGKPELTGFNLKPLNKQEVLALRSAFKIR